MQAADSRVGAPATPLIDIEGLHVSYGPRPVLRGVDLAVAAGEVVGLVGPNGCGKTTLIRALCRLVPARAGRLSLGGRDVAAISRTELARTVAVVPQSAVLPAGYTALEIVVMGRTPHLRFLEQETAEDYEIARAALRQVGAEDLAQRPVDELSGGERQNVLLARGLAQETPVLLLDEPTANLDIGHQMAVFRLVRELAAGRGLAVLTAIHDLTLASIYCDRVALMSAGRIMAEGSPETVLTRENIARVYGAEVMVVRPAALGRPLVVPATPEDGG